MDSSQRGGVQQLLEQRPDAEQLLTVMVRGMFPHPQAPDGPYQRVARSIVEQAGEDAWAAMTVALGLESLDAAASGSSFVSLAPEDVHRVLVGIQTTPFFGFVRKVAVANLYEDEEMWGVLGYEGPSFDKGGYINRGFNDLDWLPEPRIEEYEGELVEVVGLGAVATGRPVTGATGDSGANTETAAAPVGQTFSTTGPLATGRADA